MNLTATFTHFASSTSRLVGRAATFVLCIGLIVVWAVTGPLFHFSDTWQLVINTSTTIITFLMVFLIQNTQNRDNAAIQCKLDELIRVSAAKNAMIGIEKLTDKELEAILREFDQEVVSMEEKSRIIADRAKAAHDRRQGKTRAAKPKVATRAKAR